MKINIQTCIRAYTIKFIAICLIVVGSVFNSALYSQKIFTLYGLNDAPQAMNLNPGFKTKHRIYISLPSGMQHFGVNNTGFRLNDALEKRADDSLVINPALAVNKMAEVNNINIESYNEIFAFGIRLGKNYISFNATNRFNARFTYPKELFQFAVEGNGTRLNERIALDGLRIDALSYIEYALGFNRTLTDKFTVGGKLKLLSGIANINTKRSELGLFTDSTSYSITIDGAAEVRTSNVAHLYDSNYARVNMVSSAFNFRNTGVAIDLGAHYQLNDKLSITASLLDLGTIRWKSSIANYQTNEFNYTFKGVDFNKVITDSLSLAEGFSDTLKEVFRQEINTDNYSTALMTRFYIGGNFQLNKFVGAGALLYNEIFANKFSSAISVNGNVKVKNWIKATVNYTIVGRSANNIGVGFILKGGPTQFTFMTDNINAAINPAKAKYAQFLFGVSIVIGEKKLKT